jgi:hypothetical protein
MSGEKAWRRTAYNDNARARISFQPILKRCKRWSRRRVRSVTPRSPNATRPCRKMTACGISCTNCSARNLAGVRRSSIPSSYFWRSRISSKSSRPTKPKTTRRTQWPPRRAATSATPAAARFPTRSCDDRARGRQLSLLPGAHACHRRGDLAAARRDPGAVPGERLLADAVLCRARGQGGCNRPCKRTRPARGFFAVWIGRHRRVSAG